MAFRGREMILELPDYDHAVKWAQMECRSYKIPPLFSIEELVSSPPARQPTTSEIHTRDRQRLQVVPSCRAGREGFDQFAAVVDGIRDRG